MDTILESRNLTGIQHGVTLVGWVTEGSNRGTWDIIDSCFLTILICTWTAIHPRIHVIRRLRNTHKILQLVKTLLAPEMVCLESMQEWVQARKTIRRCAPATDGRLGMAEAFYLGMLGVRYRYGPAAYRVLWPGQFAWLLNNNLIRWDDIRDTWGLAADSIRDKSKADGLVKLAALFQVVWFTLQCITRGAHGLPLAALEIMTIAYVVVMVVTYFFWWLKPKDIATVSLIDLPYMDIEQWEVFESLTMENTYDVLDPTAPWDTNIAWYLIARDCKDDEVLIMPRLDRQDTPPELSQENTSVTTSSTPEAIIAPEHEPEKHILSRARPLQVHTLHQEVEEESDVITEWDSGLYMTRWWPLICLMGASFGAVHLIAWNSVFPTSLELWLWRSSAVISVATSILCMQFRKMSLRWDGPLTMVRVASPLLYVISRTIMTAQTFAALRAMPEKTYETFDLWNYWFHFF